VELRRTRLTQMVRYGHMLESRPVSIEASAALNGEPLDLDAHPKKPPRRRRRS